MNPRFFQGSSMDSHWFLNDDVEGKFPWGIERYEMLTREQSRVIHSRMSLSGGGWQSIMVQSGIMEGVPDD